jgi:hypothetical protein
MDRRILELALEALEERKSQIDKEIAGLQAEIGRPTSGARKSQSDRMKAYWEKRRAEAAKTALAKAPAVAKKSGPQSAAARKAVSDRMKAWWAKRRAKAPKK